MDQITFNDVEETNFLNFSDIKAVFRFKLWLEKEKKRFRGK